MHSQQREPIATVMQVAEDGIATPRASAHDEIICTSWARRAHEPRRVLPAHEAHGDRIAEPRGRRWRALIRRAPPFNRRSSRWPPFIR